LIVSGELSDWQVDSLKAVGYPPDRYIQHREVIDIDRLLIPPHPLRTSRGEFQICPSAIQWVRDRILYNISPGSSNFPRRVYVSRADANHRQVVNKNDVISLLNQHEFESFEPGRLSFEDQVRLFANADVVIGPHGAGLTNIIYGSSLKVLELMIKESGEHYFVLSNEHDYSYDYLICKPVSKLDTKPKFRGMYVDIKNIEEKVCYLIRYAGI